MADDNNLHIPSPAMTSAEPPSSPPPADGAIPPREPPGATATQTALPPSAPPPPKATPSNEPKDVKREIVETVVFVVVLVLLLKTFVAEAFVIPTGSMATTLWGYQKVVTCPQCGHVFPVNCSSEVDPQSERVHQVVTGCTCPNCRLEIDFARDRMNPPWNSGDRVLVMKCLYDTFLRPPTRHDVVVFKYPEKPQQNYVAMNYIKRLMGLPGETIAIHGGKLYVTKALDYHWKDKPDRDPRLIEYMYTDDTEAKTLFEQGLRDPKKRTFQIIRKAPDLILSLGRLVFDNDSQAKDLVGVQEPRWSSQDPWKPDNPKEPRRFEFGVAPGAERAGGDSVAWLRYHHLLRDRSKPELITDFSGYNSAKTTGSNGQLQDIRSPGPNWVSDLYLECDVQVDRPQGELRLELSKGVDRFQARFDLTTGMCTFVRLHDVNEKQTTEETLLITRPGAEPEKAVRQTPLNKPGTYHLRFANEDERLVLWVDGQLPFGEGVEYEPSAALGPTVKNDLEPASIGVQGAALSVSHLKLWRDTYYTVQVNQSSDTDLTALLEGRAVLPSRTMYVQPGHYLCLGDNSPESADGRAWGLVPERLMLGRALMVYFPFYPFGGANRIGPIR